MDETVIRLFNTQNPKNVLDPLPNQVLPGQHYGPEFAVAVTDYPYGRRLRCIMRYWLEFKKGKGTRLVSQTNNPKRPGLVWNKPHAGVYVDGIVCFYVNAEGHVKHDSFTNYGLWNMDATTMGKLEAWEQKYIAAFTDSDHEYMRRFRNEVDRRLTQLATPHVKALNFTCPTCKNYGEACTGTAPSAAGPEIVKVERRYVREVNSHFERCAESEAQCIGEYRAYDDDGIELWEHVRDLPLTAGLTPRPVVCKCGDEFANWPTGQDHIENDPYCSGPLREVANRAVTGPGVGLVAALHA